MKTFSKAMALIVMVSAPALASADVKVSNITAGAVKTSYNADDILNKYGRMELEQQVRAAAGKECGPQELKSAVSVKRMIDNRNCYEKAVKAALSSTPAIG